MSAARLLLALTLLGLLLVAQMAGASSAAAHAELVGSTPSNGATLDEPPAEVTLRFTESIGLLADGIRLLDADGKTVTTPEPVADGDTVRWAMPQDLPDGAYLVNWRVVSADSHPVAGAFSFAVGTGAAVDPVRAGQVPSVDVPVPVTAARFAGYLGFALIAGSVAVGVLCWKAGRRDPVVQGVLRGGFLTAGAATVLAMLLQGPYAAGRPLADLFDPTLLAATAHTGFGGWTQLRFFVVLAMAAVLWPSGSLTFLSSRWIAIGGVLGIAATFSGTSHAAASNDVLERVVDSLHVLTAGTWAGGLLVLAVVAVTAGQRPDLAGLRSFSRVALVCVVVLSLTGVLNSVYRLPDVQALWRSDYGRLLLLKLVTLTAALVAAWLSRRRLNRDAEPVVTVRLEAMMTVAILVITAVLASVSPPSTATAAGQPEHRPAAAVVAMPLQEGASAQVRVDKATTEGSVLTITLAGAGGEEMAAKVVSLSASLPAKDVGPLEIDLRRHQAQWHGSFTFPYPGTWRLTLTVEAKSQSAVVTSGDVDIE